MISLEDKVGIEFVNEEEKTKYDAVNEVDYRIFDI